MFYEFITLGVLLTLAALYFLTHVLVRAKRRSTHKDDVHVFLDLETLGVTPGSAVMVIAAYAINGLGDCIGSMQAKVNRISAQEFGTFDDATIKWWGEQSSTAQNEAFVTGPRVQLPDALAQLDALFLSLGDADIQVWGNAPTIDCQLLRDAYAATGGKVPWAYYQERDCRTLASLAEFKDTMEFEGTPHVAIHDARHQARYTIATIRKLLGY